MLENFRPNQGEERSSPLFLYWVSPWQRSVRQFCHLTGFFPREVSQPTNISIPIDLAVAIDGQIPLDRKLESDGVMGVLADELSGWYDRAYRCGNHFPAKV